VCEMLIEAVEMRSGSVKSIPVTHARRSCATAAVRTLLTPREARLGRGPQADRHVGMQPTEQRHGRVLRLCAQARLRQPNGPERCGRRAGAATSRGRTILRGTPEIATRVRRHLVKQSHSAQLGKITVPVRTPFAHPSACT
jgi:hypothetical protein